MTLKSRFESLEKKVTGPHKIIAISLVQLQEVTQSPGQSIKIYNPMFLATKPKSFVDRNCGVRSVRKL